MDSAPEEVDLFGLVRVLLSEGADDGRFFGRFAVSVEPDELIEVQ